MPQSNISYPGSDFSGRDETGHAEEETGFEIAPAEFLSLLDEIDCDRSSSASLTACLQSGATHAYLRI